LRKPVLASFLLVTAVLLSYYCLPVSGHILPAVVLSAWAPTPPTINGVLAPGEWAAADTETFTVIGSNGRPFNCKIYVMNDATNLYLALEIPDTDDEDDDSLGFIFDNNHNGIGPEVGDDGLSNIGFSPGSFQDSYIDGGGLGPDPIGLFDGSSVHTFDGAFHYYEFSHPLDSADDPHDFSLSLGQTVGFAMLYWEDLDGAAETFQWPGNFWEPMSYGDIIIASPPAPPAPKPPVGGEVLSVDKLTLLAPYIAATLLIATTATIIKKRRH